MELHYLIFEESTDTDGVEVFDAIASTSGDQLAAVQAEVDAVLEWARATFNGRQGPVGEGFDWDVDLQQGPDPDGGGQWHTTRLSLGGSAAFAQAFRDKFFGHWPNGTPARTSTYIFMGQVVTLL